MKTKAEKKVGKIKWVIRSCSVCSSKNKTDVFSESTYDPKAIDAYAFASRKIPDNRHYRLITCPDCNLLYADPIPTLGHFAESYHEASFDSSEEAHFAARTYASFLPDIKKELPDTKGALDIGTGDGAFLEELLKKGFTNVLGIEPSQAPIDVSHPSVRRLIKKGLFAAKNYKKNSLSLITCFQTFEHLYEPLKVTKAAHGILKKGGAFFIVSHNRLSLANRLLGMKSPIFDIEHLQLFSPQSAKKMMEISGFERVVVKTVWNVYPLHYLIKLLPIPKGLKVGVIRVLKVIKVGHLPVLMPAGNMAVIGYKK